MRFILFTVAISIAVAGSVWANDEVRGVQEKLRDDGFYTGEIDGAYSSDLSAALTRYQIKNGLPITGQLDVDTSKALGTKPAVTNSAADAEQSSETWRRLRRGQHKKSTSAERSETAATEARKTSSPSAEETESTTETRPRSAPAAKARISSETAESEPAPAARGSEETEPASAPPATGSKGARAVSAPPGTERTLSSTTERVSAAPAKAAGSSEDDEISIDRVRDYVAAFVLAGLDPKVGSEADFFADRVKYYDQGVMDREKIRKDLQNYAARWPQRRFWFAGNITIEPHHRKRVRVTFPLRYELRNGATYSSGMINKTLILEPVGDDLQIVAVSERKAENED
jgi:hypothetical protein